MNEPTSAPVGGAPFAWWRFLFWMLICFVHGAAVAWAAMVVHNDFDFAPLVFFPLLTGVVLGATGVGLVRLCQMGNRPTALLGTVLAAAVTVVGQHYIGYREACREERQQAETYRKAERAFPDLLKGRIPAPPAGLLDFLRSQAAQGRPILAGHVARGWLAWLTWSCDAFLLLAASLAMMIPALKQPYCSRCSSWYRTMRNGRIDAETARILAETARMPLAASIKSARYRLLSCNGGCGPAGFELSWEDLEGDTSSARTWLDADCRNRVMQVLDEAGPHHPKTPADES